MASNINADSFIATGKTTDRGTIDGSVEVTLGATTKRVPAAKGCFGIVAFGVVGRYRTGDKAWKASITLSDKGLQSIWFGRDERTGRCQKIANQLSFAE